MNELEAIRAKLKCLEMVEGTGLNWWDVIRLAGHKCKTAADFSYPTACYTFALGIVEGKPVWKGDKLYDEFGTDIIIVTTMLSCNGWSWNPPASKTLMVELPIADVEYYAMERPLSINMIDAMIERRANACLKALRNMK